VNASFDRIGGVVPGTRGRDSRTPKRAACVVVRFPDSTEIRYLDEPPEPGSRIRSATGREWFVAETLPSGRNTYTVFCVGRQEFLEEAGSSASRGRVLADDLVALARRSARLETETDVPSGSGRRDRRYVASVVDSDGRALEYIIAAASPSEAEREAREGAHEWDVTLVDVRPLDDAPAEPRGRRSPAAWLHALVRGRGGAR
jgi:hypothetical protein